MNLFLYLPSVRFCDILNAYEIKLTHKRGIKMSELCANEGKNTTITVDGKEYMRLPIKTHVVTENDKITDVAEKYAAEHMQEGDILFISEKCVACALFRLRKSIRVRLQSFFVSLFTSHPTE